ncbi:uncharacterized protein LOC131293841 [Anopheles ziemanni]|uniref:uncharacterized protein LOC131264611 n=1 Tax=Anopheles coustani TaxID=139045 RepID=UPI00265A874D|nr:uncharacterized protein LOC131264611 [Anopheles coustani]XP_058177877.1 uncharacterized protein LOC131293841 [Anopheles ziemanni]
MIDQQPKISYFPMEMKCNLGNQQEELEGGGGVGGGGNSNNGNANITTTVNNTATGTGPIGTTGACGTGRGSACGAKTPITTATPTTLQGHPIATAPNVTTTTPAGGSTEQRLLLAGVMSDADLGGGPGTGGHTHLAGLLGTSLCGQCCSPICDRYIMKVVDSTYHERCLQCTSCSIRLMHSCFMRDGKLYCRFDYERLYGRNRCLGCGDKIGADELVMRALDNVFHLKCFICVVCGVRLQKGDQYVIKQSQLFCRPDYEKEVEMFQGYSYDDYCCDDMFQTRIDGRRGPKRPRTILTTQQRRAFKASFDISPKPCRKIREGLAKDTGLSIRIVQVWFQNQRAKMKKIQKKQLKEGNKGAHHGGGGGTGSKNHSGGVGKGGNDSQEELSDNESGGAKLSLRIKDENSRSNTYLHDSCSDNEGTVTDNDGGTYGGGTGRLSLGGPDPYKIVKEELDLEDDYFRLAMGSTHGHNNNNNNNNNNHHHHHHHHHHHQHQHNAHPHQHGPHGGARFGGKSFDNELHSNAGTGPGIKTENMNIDPTTTMHSNEPLEYGVSLQHLTASMNGGPPSTSNHHNNTIGHPASSPQDAISGSGMLNPIDRLYSMQNSYFCNQETSGPNAPGHPGTPPNGSQRPSVPSASLQQQNPMHLQHHGVVAGLQHQTMSQPGPHQQHGYLPNSPGLGGQSNSHINGLCNTLLEQQQQQQQQQESVM